MPNMQGFMAIDCRLARATGLRTRALRDTIEAVLDEPLPAPGDRRVEGKLTREREAALLAGWAARPPGGISTGEMR